ncbi:MAG TPA: BMP family ABC transporter substrate-binding protein [Egicoccus sp.]|nr:BMP family ABC transporter substrate-binding protein [Egicoccus sp.]HSK22811.1 BMP family ABC transporter substrate-binding protein [Egicoccus sp.]
MRVRPPLVGATLLAVVALAVSCSTAPDPTPAAGTQVAGAVEVARSGGVIGADADLGDLCVERFADLEVDRPLHVGLMTDSGSVNDGTFNQFAYEGMQAAARCFGFETTYVASGASDDYAAHLRDLVQDVDAVVTVGFPLTEATEEVAADYPDVVFVGIDQTVDHAGDNYARVTYRDDQGGFLAGVAAGLLTRSGTVGVVAGPDDVPPVVDLAEGFEAGIAHVGGDVTVLRDHLDSFSDPEAGADKADEFTQAGADVIYAPAGMTGSGAILRAAQRGAWVIGVDQDQYLTTFEGGRVPGSERIATSTVKRVDLGVFLQLADLAAGAFRGGQVALDAATGGVSYAPAHEADIPADVHARLEEVRRELATGALGTDGREAHDRP